MAGDRPDFQLIVGVDHTLSYDQMRDDINDLVAKLNGDPPKIKISLDIDEASQKALKEQVENATKATQAAKRSGGSNAFNINTELTRLSNLRNGIDKNLRNWTAASGMQEYKNLEMLLTQTNNLYDRVSGGHIVSADDIKGYKEEIDGIKNGVLQANSGIILARKNTKSWGDRFGGLAEKFNTWLTISKFIMAAYKAIGKMVKNVIALDTAMTELKKVTNETDAAYSAFLDRAAKRAKTLGAALTDTVNATADFARLGFGINDAEKLADVAIVYKNVGDGIEDISTASESIIATMQAFGIAADDAMSIVDKFNEVGNNYAISSKGVGDALLRSAAAMHAANNSLDETIALATAANTVVKFVPRCYGNIAA